MSSFIMRAMSGRLTLKDHLNMDKWEKKRKEKEKQTKDKKLCQSTL